MSNVKKGGRRSKKLRVRSAKMMDEIEADLRDDERRDSLVNRRPVDVEAPGLNQFFCLECDRLFISEAARQTHRRGKVHKARVRRMKESAYSIQESVRAAGVGRTDTGVSRDAMAM